MSNKVPEMKYSDIEEIPPRVLNLQGSSVEEGKQGLIEAAIGTQAMRRRKSQPRVGLKVQNPKLKEAECFLPFNLLALSYAIASKTSKALQKLMVFGSMQTRVALVDQMLYFIKELMLDSPEEYLISQCS